MAGEYIKNVAKIKLYAEKCIGCGMCTEVCPHEVLSIAEEKVQFKEKDRCIECGACQRNCPVDAIEVSTGVG